MDQLKAVIRTKDTDLIYWSLMAFAPRVDQPIQPMTTEERMVRAALVDVYIERLGDAAGDLMMDVLGL